MLSQNPILVQRQQQQHRRQQSTPQVFEQTHRQRRQSPPSDYSRPAITVQGFQHRQHQHISRETQQQRLSGPGQQISQPYLSHDEFGDNHAMPYMGLDGQLIPEQYCLTDNMLFQPGSMYSQPESQQTPLFIGESNLPVPYLDFPAGYQDVSAQQDWAATVRPNRSRSRGRLSGSISARVAQHETMRSEQPISRPITPPDQNAKDYFPSTSTNASYYHQQRNQPIPQRFLDNYDDSMEDTIKPIKNASKAQNTFEEMRQRAEANIPPSPPTTGPIPSVARFDSVKMPSGIRAGIKSEYTPDVSYQSPSGSYIDSRASTPGRHQDDFYETSFDNQSTFNQPRRFEPLPGSEPNETSQADRARRSESVDSLNLEEAMTDTGITIDDIAVYISSPQSDSVDQKWTCLFPGCSKKFGRKENIKSHVQTHLGDRQYQCSHCKKCFVRQHDLKRHAKIHSGVKPYPCACGNSFARHDALTRHRQRGMCIGAFDGIVKKTVKRGRPRKARPDDEERLDKASRTRSRVANSQASGSEYSESAYSTSPGNDFDDVLDDKPFAGFETSNRQLPQYDPRVYAQQTSVDSSSAFSPHDDLSGAYISPAMIQNEFQPTLPVEYPSANMQYRNNSIISLPSSIAARSPCTPSPSKSAYSPAPGLTLTSSSPIPHQAHSTPARPSPISFSQATPGLGNLANLSMGDLCDEDMFLEQFGLNAEEPSMLKFEDPFVDERFGLGMDLTMGMDMYGDLEQSGDVFFGSP